MIFIVLGMHKSGTTLLSQTLHHSGINMGDFDENQTYDGGNKYERQSALDLNLEILGTEKYTVLLPDQDQPPVLTPELRSRMRQIIDQCQTEHADWGFKDPRTTVLYDLWREELPPHKVIAIYRDPAQVWSRFRWAGWRGYYANFRHAKNFCEVWQAHSLNLLKVLKSPATEHVLLSYHDLMSSDTEFRRLEEFVGRPLVDRRNKALYRNKGCRDLHLLWADWQRARRRGESLAGTLAALQAARG